MKFHITHTLALGAIFVILFTCTQPLAAQTPEATFDVPKESAPETPVPETTDKPQPPSSPVKPFQPIAPTGDKIRTLRQMLDLLGLNASYWNSLTDGRDLELSESEPLVKILYETPRISPLRMQQWSTSDIPWSDLVKEPAEWRSKAFHITGRVTNVKQVPLIPEMALRFDFRKYYQVSFTLDDGTKAIVCTRTIPEQWKPGAKLDERASAWGLFLKTGKAKELIFAASAIHWNPDRVSQQFGIAVDHVWLGKRGVDFGQFAKVEDRRSLSSDDRELTFQILGALGDADTTELSQMSRRGDIVKLLQQPEAMLGTLNTFTGLARRIVRVEVSDPSIRQRLGVDHFYEIDMFVPLDKPIRFRDKDNPSEKTDLVFKHNFPVTLFVRSLPEGMPQGDDVHETIRISAFFIKIRPYRTSYATQQGDQYQLGPFLIGAAPERVKLTSDPNPWMTTAVGVGFAVILLGVFILLWFYRRGDKEEAARRSERFYSVPEGESLNEKGIQSSDGPDFSNLE